MRVLHIDSGKYWRGSQKQIWLLSREERRKGIDSWVIARPNSPLFMRCVESGIPTAGVKVRFEIDPIALAGYLRLFSQVRPSIVVIHVPVPTSCRFGSKIRKSSFEAFVAMA